MKGPVAVMLLMPLCFVQLSSAMGRGEAASWISVEDYGLYDRIVEDKFLTSQIQLVLLEPMTVSRLVPDQDESMTMAFLMKQDYFEGLLPQDLVRDFVGANQVPSRLEGQFRFGVRYRFVSDDSTDDTEASVALSVKHHKRIPTQVPGVLDRLAFSRVGRTLKNDQALVYVENLRRDGTGAGFLVWFHQQKREWEIFDTEVVWMIQQEGR